MNQLTKEIETGWYSKASLKHRHYFLSELGKFVCGLEIESNTKFGKHKPTCAKCEHQLDSLDIMGVDDYVTYYKERNE